MGNIIGNILDLCSNDDEDDMAIDPANVSDKIQLLIRSASNLKNADIMGKSDPYCMCRVGLQNTSWEAKSKKTHRQSQPILENLNPEWNFATVYYVESVLNSLNNTSAKRMTLNDLDLHIKVMDNDLFSSNELLGEICIPVRQLSENSNVACAYRLAKGSSIVVMVGSTVETITENTMKKQLNADNNMLPMWLNSFQQYIEKSDDELVYTTTMLQFLMAGLNGDTGLRRWFLEQSGGNSIWYGPEETNCITYYSHSEVNNRLKRLPSELGTNNENGISEKPNNLGFQKLNTLLWQELPEGERCIGLGQTQENHKLARHFLERILSPDGRWNKQQITDYAKAFFNCKHTFKTSDFKIWTMIVLHKIIFDMDLSWDESKEFSEMQIKILVIIAPTENLINNYLVRKALNVDKILEQKAAWMAKYKIAIQNMYPVEMALMTPEQITMVTSNLMDSLLFAGGQSVPTVLSYCTTLLYSDWLRKKLPDFTLNIHNVYQYIMEVIRFFPPVSGFVYKERSMGGRPAKKIYLNIHMAQCDKNAWGDDAYEFKLRPMKDYNELMLAWANSSVGDEERKYNSRVCPAKDLSMVMISEILKEFIRTTVPLDSGIKGGISLDTTRWLSDTRSKEVKINNYGLTNIKLTKNRTGHVLTDEQVEHLWFDGHGNKFDEVDGHTKLFTALVQATVDPTNQESADVVKTILPKQKLKTDYVIGDTGIRLTSHDEDANNNAIVNLLKSAAFYATKHFSFNDKLVWFDSYEEGIKAMRDEFSKHLPPQYNYWDDVSSDAAMEKICFYGVGQMYVQNCSKTTDVPDGTKYEINLEYLGKYATRDNFIKYGHNVYFDENKKLIGIWSCDKEKLFKPTDTLWEHIKFAFRSTLVTDLTLKHHLAHVHLTISNKLMLAARETCDKDHPLRRLLKAHYFNTAAINWGAKQILLPVDQLAHRTWGFTEESWGELFKDIFNEWSYKPLDTQFNEINLDCKSDLPLYTDGISLWNVMRNYVENYLLEEISLSKDVVIQDDEIIDFWNHFNVDFKYGLGELTFDNLVDHITNSIWWCTAGHEMVGSIVEYLVHPDGLMPKVCKDKTIADAQTFTQALIVISLTGLRQPALMNDWEHLFTDVKYTQQFQMDLLELSKQIDKLNETRLVPYNVMNPKVLESSVSI